MRLRLFWGMIVLLFCILVIRLWNIQVIHGNENFVFSEENRIKLIPLDAPRGYIFDKNMQPLVINRACFNVFIIPEEIIKHPESITLLSELLEISSEYIWKKIKINKPIGFLPVRIKKDISREKIAQLEERSMYLKGVYVLPDAVREYTKGDFSSHVIGYVGEINRKELNELRDYGYQIRDVIGKDGVEKTYDSYLQGIKGGQQVEVSATGRHEKILSRKDPVKGNDIILSIDTRIQEIIENGFANEKGSVIVVDPNNGDLLGMVSKPSFNPNVFVDSSMRKELVEVLNDSKNMPIMNRAIKGLYPPGSLFKLVIGAAGLETGMGRKSVWYNCKGWLNIGRIFHCWAKDGHGDQNIVDAIQNSCNVYFFMLGTKLGIKKIVKYAKALGFGEKTGIELSSEKAGLLPTSKWKKNTYKEKWYLGDTVNMSIGQGYLLTTPIQLIYAISAIINGGILYQPTIVKRIIRNDGVEFEPCARTQKNLKFKKTTVNTIKEGMFEAVNSPFGTGRLAKIQGAGVCGKTATVQVARREVSNRDVNKIPRHLRNHAWFACFAPYDKPKIAMLVFVEHGHSGGYKAAVVAKAMLKQMHNEGII